ncbi:MAG: rhodanese-like domain-containing protein [Defluviitaleaceae bacterium]|nr:rhodanese-like domain-containing protein [Defluviitaleaceae bacterium]
MKKISIIGTLVLCVVVISFMVYAQNKSNNSMITLTNAVLEWDSSSAEGYKVVAYTNDNGNPGIRIREAIVADSPFNLQTDFDLPTPRQALIMVQSIASGELSAPVGPFNPGGNPTASPNDVVNRSAPSPEGFLALRNAAGEGNYIIIDARMRDEFLEGHVPGAIHFADVASSPYGNPFDTDGIIPEAFAQVALDGIRALPAYNGFDTLIITYCRGGNRSVPIANWFAMEGYTNVFDGATPANLALAFGNVIPVAVE